MLFQELNYLNQDCEKFKRDLKLRVKELFSNTTLSCYSSYNNEIAHLVKKIKFLERDINDTKIAADFPLKPRPENLESKILKMLELKEVKNEN